MEEKHVRIITPDYPQSSLAMGLRIHTEVCDRFVGYQDHDLESQMLVDPDVVLPGASINVALDGPHMIQLLGGAGLVHIMDQTSHALRWVYAQRVGHILSSDVSYDLFPYFNLKTEFFTSYRLGGASRLRAWQLARLVLTVRPFNVISLPEIA